MSNLLEFPRGLLQPEGCYRFGQDALLLGSWCAEIAGSRGWGSTRVADLGAGCGAALFAFLLLRANAMGTGFEREAKLLEAAVKNAVLLGLEEKADFLHADFNAKSYGIRADLQGEFNMVMANPPWRINGEGRPSPRTLRQKALCGPENALAVFAGAARMLLTGKGRFCCIFPARKLADFCAIMTENKLGIRSLRPVTAFADASADRLLALCQKNAAHDPRLLPALVLYVRKSNGIFPTREALDFCPWINGSG